jgi:hypothetical protein
MISMVPAPADRVRDFGITHRSLHVYRNPRATGYPTRVNAWDNHRRPLPSDDGPAWQSPRGDRTTEPLSLLLAVESMVLARRGGTGTEESGQTWAPQDGPGQGTLQPGDTVCLLWWNDDKVEPTIDATVYAVSFPPYDNGHGLLLPVPASC